MRTSRRRPLLAAVACLAMTIPLAATLAPSAPATAAVAASVVINEVESDGGSPGDWIEITNTTAAPVDVSGWVLRDNKEVDPIIIGSGTVLAPGAFLVLDAGGAVFGLGAADSARLFAADGVTLVDSYSWTAHAATTYGRYPDGTGPFVVGAASTRGAANQAAAVAPVVVPPVAAPVTPTTVKLNEIESSGGTPGDWIELKNTGTSAADVSGLVLRDNDDTHTFVIPAATTIAAGGYYVADVDPSYGLGGADSARLFAADGVTLIDSYTWTAAAATTYARCPDGTGAFASSAASTRGAVNDCGVVAPTPTPAATPSASPWPGSAAVTTVDTANTLGGNMSGLAYEATPTGDVLWAVKNGPGTLYRLLNNGTNWVSDTTGGWAAGKVLHYANGTGDVDAEGVTLTSGGAAAGVYVSSERDNSANGTSRLSVLRYDVTAAATSLNATREWNLTADLPVVGANLGLEAIAWVPDAFLVQQGLLDETTNAAYDPSRYAAHGSGLFFVGLEANGTVYAYALSDSGAYTRVATIASGFTGVMDLEFEASTGSLWAECDDTCSGRSATLRIAQSGASDGRFVATQVFERPASMPNINNEGFALASQCVDGAKAAFWADDSNTGGFAIRAGQLNCSAAITPAVTPTTPVRAAVSGPAARLAATGVDVTQPLGAALLLLVAGAAMVVLRRRRSVIGE
jgi:hypothetical protein